MSNRKLKSLKPGEKFIWCYDGEEYIKTTLNNGTDIGVVHLNSGVFKMLSNRDRAIPVDIVEDNHNG